MKGGKGGRRREGERERERAKAMPFLISLYGNAQAESLHYCITSSVRLMGQCSPVCLNLFIAQSFFGGNLWISLKKQRHFNLKN